MAGDRTSLSAQLESMTLGDKKDEKEDEQSELVTMVDELLNNLSKKFDGVSSEILAKMDEMSKRIDALEASILAGNSQEESATESAK